MVRARTGDSLRLAIPLGDFSVEALSDAAGTTCSVEAVARQAVYYYLAEGDGGRPGWPYPKSLGLGGAETGAEETTLSLRIEAAAWGRFVEEAERQRVSPELLARHAVLLFAADVEAGRVARRMLDELREPGDAG
jgi:hypothetical protein